MIRRLLTQLLHTAKENKRTCLFFVFLALLLSGAVIFTHFNAFLYSCPVGEVTDVTTKPIGTFFSPANDSETHYKQTLTVQIINGKEKGQTVVCENECTDSGVYDETYENGDTVLLEKTEDGFLITGTKRDTVAVTVFALLLFAVIAVSRKKGVFTLLSVAVNCVLFSYAMDAYLFHGINILLSAIGVSVLFCCITLLIVCGFSKKALAAIISTLLSVVFVTILTFSVIGFLDFDGIFAEGVEYLIIEADYRFTFLAMLLVGGLGAIMDVCVSMTAGMFEVAEKDSTVTRSALSRSGKAIGRDIMDTMINVLLFTYLCGSIPYVLLIQHNGFVVDIGTVSLEVARFLCGGCGIAAAVVISRLICLRMLGRRDDK